MENKTTNKTKFISKKSYEKHAFIDSLAVGEV